MNLNKFTKAELISKMKKQQAKLDPTNENKIKLVETLLFFKKWILTLSIFAFLIKIFKNYSMVHKVLRVGNWIVLTIFGISLFDHFSLTGFITQIRTALAGIVGYITETDLYMTTASIFGGAQVTKKESNKGFSGIPGTSSKTNGYEEYIRKNERDSKILDWLRENDNKKEDSNKSKYLLLLLLLLIGSGIWIYGPDIKDYCTPDFIKSIFSWTSSIRTWFHDIKWASRDLNTSIEKLKKYSDLSDFIPNPNKSYKNFDEEADALLFKLNRFMSVWNNKDIMDRKLCYTVYKALNEWVDNLNSDYPKQFAIYMDDTSHSAIMNSFWDLRNNMDTFWDDIEKEEIKDDSMKQKTTYDKAEESTKLEQEEWETESQTSGGPMSKFFKKMKRKVTKDTASNTNENQDFRASTPPLTANIQEIKEQAPASLGHTIAPTPSVNNPEPTHVSEKHDVHELEQPKIIETSIDNSVTNERGGLFDAIRQGKSLKNAKDRVLADKIPAAKAKSDSKNLNLPSEEENAKATTSKVTLDNEPMNIYEEIRLGKKLKSVKTREKTPLEAAYKEPTEPDSLMGSLFKKFDKMKKIVTAEDDLELEDTQSVWSDEGKKPSIVVTPVDSKTPVGNLTPQRSKTPIADAVSSFLGLSPRASSKDLPEFKGKGKDKLSDLEHLVLQWNQEVEEGAVLSDNYIKSQTKNLSLSEIFEVSKHSDIISEDQKNFLKRIHLTEEADKIALEHPKLSKMELVELLTKNNPDHKQEIIELFNQAYTETDENISSKLTGKKLKNYKSRVLKADLDDLSSLSENVNPDRINTLKKVNKSYASLLDEIKDTDIHALNKNLYKVPSKTVDSPNITTEEPKIDESFSKTKDDNQLFYDDEIYYKADVNCFNRNGERTVELKLPVLEDNIESLVIKTNDNHVKAIKLNKESFDPNKIITIVWGDLFALDRLDFTTEIYELSLQDNEGKLHVIYTNTAVLFAKDKIH